MMASGRSRGNSGEWEKPFWQQRGWQVSAAFLLAMILVGAVALLTGDGDGKPPAQAGPSATPQETPGGGTASTPPQDSGDGRPAGCRTDDTDQSVPKKGPADLKWKVYGEQLIPVSATAGPLKYEGGVWSCFARTPMGAVLALHSISNKMGGSEWKTVADRQMAAGPGRDQFVAKRSKVPDDVPTAAPGSEGSYVGFSFLTYSKDQATVMALVRLPEKGYATATFTAVWEDGDWKLRPTLTGSTLEGMTAVGGTEGFTLWGGQGAS